ncbi:MAG: prepilin-type N-terminal cleavage/methylation domain-containing protein [Acidobacteria bacterium]|nr:prepilin-type N-terminal cleavage/methylation domain-containing protein [Acidobacteriota bacterium]MCI0722734.1 prepilin-type N-terminal cleavage/methylation domain-containing protein [Acidobacteriota bacterium]
MRFTRNRQNTSGFTLVELLIVLAIFGLLMGAVFSSLAESQNASAIARDESEMNQNLQDVVTLMTSEMRFIGFPPSSYYDQSYLQNPGSAKNLVAQGMVEAGNNFLKFQGDINGDDTVDYVHYYLSGAAAPYSLHRFGGSINPDGSLPGGSAQKISEQVEGLQFRYFDRSGNETSSLADIATIELRITLRTKQVDPLTKIYRTLSESTRIHPQNL